MKFRIYILPTRMGGYLNGLIFLMFLLSVGYNNNLLLIITLFLFALNLMWVIQTHFHLHRLKIESISISDAHAGEPSQVIFHWKKYPDGPQDWNLILISNKQKIPVAITSTEINRCEGQITFPKRGLIEIDHILIKTEKPFGLYKTWARIPVKVSAWVYPERLRDLPLNISQISFQEGENPTYRKGPHDVWNLGPYQNDESRKISWKHYARTGDIVVKEGEDLKRNEILFKIMPTTDDKEFMLSKVATQIVYCAKTETLFGLEFPDKKTVFASDDRHLKECLRMLTVC
jgi:uncharacterized protein (DUF58 family)